MPKGSLGQKRKADMIGNAFLVMKITAWNGAFGPLAIL